LCIEFTYYFTPTKENHRSESIILIIFCAKIKFTGSDCALCSRKRTKRRKQIKITKITLKYKYRKEIKLEKGRSKKIEKERLVIRNE
jgi:hypothetical protein